ncbi:MAG: CarD family transcriptional regulator [Clostridiaceae bacterium]|nr:CarD family transcriptional regulator [Clostridiaceae bacterium]
MYQIGDHVVYHSVGVCRIIDICRKDFGDASESEYFVLETVYGNTMTVYIPTDNYESVLRPLMTKEELLELVWTLPDTNDEWIADNATRKEMFHHAILSKDQSELIRMIKLLYTRKQDLENEGKRLAFSDSEAMKEAEKLLTNEFAFVLGIEPDQVVPFIIEQLSDHSN